MHLPPPSFIILCLFFRKVSSWQTNKPTNKQTDRRRWKHPAHFATLRRIYAIIRQSETLLWTRISLIIVLCCTLQKERKPTQVVDRRVRTCVQRTCGHVITSLTWRQRWRQWWQEASAVQRWSTVVNRLYSTLSFKLCEIQWSPAPWLHRAAAALSQGKHHFQFIIITTVVNRNSIAITLLEVARHCYKLVTWILLILLRFSTVVGLFTYRHLVNLTSFSPLSHNTCSEKTNFQIGMFSGTRTFSMWLQKEKWQVRLLGVRKWWNYCTI